MADRCGLGYRDMIVCNTENRNCMLHHCDSCGLGYTDMIACNTENRNCMLHHCDSCPNDSLLCNQLREKFKQL